MEVQMRLLAKAIPRFIQLGGPLPPLKPMAQSQRGVIRMLEAQMRPTPPPCFELPHVLIEPSCARTAKAFLLE
jgi:hypothetical protein